MANFKIKNGLSAKRYLQSSGVDTAGANGPFGVFDTTLYTGNATSQTITNGIDLDNGDGLVWFKSRTNTYNHVLFDTERWTSSNGKGLFANSTNGEGNINELTAFNSNGFSVTGSGYINDTNNMVAWTFKKQTKFFDIVTYTGDGVVGREIAHDLGIAPGSIFVKETSGVYNWQVFHRSAGPTKFLELNTTSGQQTLSAVWDDTSPTNTVFTVGNEYGVNRSGRTYVAYLFAHDTASDSSIKCGSYTGGASSVDVNLGWSPSWLMIKRSDAVEDWSIVDSVRGMGTDPLLTGLKALTPNTSSAEESPAYSPIVPSSTGFTAHTGYDARYAANGGNYIYMAIRAVVQTQTLDLSTGHTFSFTPSEATDILFSNPPASGSATGFSVEVNNSGGYALTWPSSIKWNLGTAPTATASKELYTFVTTDGGTTYYGKKAAGDIA